ncbi:MAG: response regulator [Candidatus Scalindua sp.]|jgi:CheY-like chemotaxis protein|nr:response regulator [Candidatus Scalindua sp.]MDV5166460.1 response regulator [Candidatus Scalindua sp.]
MAKILIIDDAKFTRTMLKKMIAEFGHETIEAGNGREGLEKITGEDPDLVLTDILMPEMEGTELLELLRETNMDVSVIVISANIQDSVRDQCMNLGVSEFFGKPPTKKN